METNNHIWKLFLMSICLFSLISLSSIVSADTISELFDCNVLSCTMKPDAIKWLCNDGSVIEKNWTTLGCTWVTLYSSGNPQILSNWWLPSFTTIGDFFDCSGWSECYLKQEALNGMCNSNYTIYFTWGTTKCILFSALSPSDCLASNQTINWHTYPVPALNDSTQTWVISSWVTIPNWTTRYFQNFLCTNWVIAPTWSENLDPAKTTCSSWYSPSADWSSCIYDIVYCTAWWWTPCISVWAETVIPTICTVGGTIGCEIGSGVITTWDLNFAWSITRLTSYGYVTYYWNGLNSIYAVRSDDSTPITLNYNPVSKKFTWWMYANWNGAQILNLGNGLRSFEIISSNDLINVSQTTYNNDLTWYWFQCEYWTCSDNGTITFDLVNKKLTWEIVFDSSIYLTASWNKIIGTGWASWEITVEFK
ncbi:MAG: hypothetical protein ACD_4C00041G0003 [uncultured bacterium (gcode 4)]|uniref:Uncharacterized protein n=1 Tax=uncultured bacterium (gcode 4) TaxID=1234023 RepID=K2GUW7_9BACT|nr:MAG: hypothetical protein ACD_4C00041G0003 [uncultured bacterium (gcode 4)]